MGNFSYKEVKEKVLVERHLPVIMQHPSVSSGSWDRAFVAQREKNPRDKCTWTISFFEQGQIQKTRGSWTDVSKEVADLQRAGYKELDPIEFRNIFTC